MLHSKNIFNSCIFFQRRWYDIIQIHYDYYIKNIDKYLFYFRSKDCKELFNYCLKINNISCLKKLYQVYDKKKEFIQKVDDELKVILKKLPSLQKCKTGKSLDATEILNHLSCYNIYLNDYPDFMHQLIKVLELKLLNEEKTNINKKVTQQKETDLNLIPPSYLGTDYMDLYVKTFIP